MCGVVGIIGGCEKGLVQAWRLLTALEHCGPDDYGIEQPTPTVTLVHTRLAIIDLSPAGRQPMRDEPPQGVSPNWMGMFTIYLVDVAAGVAHLWRDRLGIKPRFTCRTGRGSLAFASEPRAVLGLNEPAHHGNPAALESYLAQGAVQRDDSIVSDVTIVRPASHLCIELATGREISRRSYWELSAHHGMSADADAQIDELKSAARETIGEHLLSDAPLGIFLSGAEVLAQMERVLAAADQPTVDSFNTYCVSRAARDVGLTVALSGLGADELFVGYASFTDALWALRLRRLRYGVRIANPLTRSRWGMKMGEAARRPADLLEMYPLRRELFLPGERRSLHALPDSCDAASSLQGQLIEELRRDARGTDAINQISPYDIQLYTRHTLLRDSDAFSMAAPIEYRVPLVDDLLVERMFALPGACNKPNGRTKPVLHQIAGSRLPNVVWKHPKRGFAFPWETRLGGTGPLAALADDAVRGIGTWSRLGLDPKEIVAIWNRFKCGDRRISALQTLALVTLRDFAARHRLSRA